MYIVKKSGTRNSVPKNLRTKFATYDRARSAIRRHLRAVEKKRPATAQLRDWLDKENRTVSIGFYGYSVEKV